MKDITIKNLKELVRNVTAESNEIKQNYL